jgi:alkanesulfonate monooxygenase SsuD/methylene tetrahydromethanopterin reductase-like flavin-dependent oxidoreductase (luciferase family)
MMAGIPQTLAISGKFADWPLDQLTAVIIRAEQVGVETAILPDEIPPAEGGAGWPDALVLIGWLAASTERIRLVGRVSSLGHQPYNLARRLASLDLISGGRAGWLVADADLAAAFAAFSGKARLEGVDLADRQVEFAAVVEGLWQSWDADALLLDKQAGRFFKPQAMHPIDHDGTHFSVRGPLNVMRSPRGKPDLLHEGDLGTVATAETPQAAFTVLERAVP